MQLRFVRSRDLRSIRSDVSGGQESTGHSESAVSRFLND
jgi:hypothetical protein